MNVWVFASMFCVPTLIFAVLFYAAGYLFAAVKGRIQNRLARLNLWLAVFIVMILLSSPFVMCCGGDLFGLSHRYGNSAVFPFLNLLVLILLPFFASSLFVTFWIGYAFKNTPRRNFSSRKDFILTRLFLSVKVLAVAAVGAMFSFYLWSTFDKYWGCPHLLLVGLVLALAAFVFWTRSRSWAYAALAFLLLAGCVWYSYVIPTSAYRQSFLAGYFTPPIEKYEYNINNDPKDYAARKLSSVMRFKFQRHDFAGEWNADKLKAQNPSYKLLTLESDPQKFEETYALLESSIYLLDDSEKTKSIRDFISNKEEIMIMPQQSSVTSYKYSKGSSKKINFFGWVLSKTSNSFYELNLSYDADE